MATDTVKNAVRKTATRQEIREAIAYWKGRLASLTEAEGDGGEGDADDDVGLDGEDGKKGSATKLPDEKSTQDKAKASPVGTFNVKARFARMHNQAVDEVKTKLAKLLHDKGLKLDEDNNIDVECSAMPDGATEFDPPDETVVVTVKVRVEKAQLKGFRKMLAVLKEDDFREFGQLEEGLLSALFTGLGDTAKGVKKAGEEKLKAANDNLRRVIGVAAVQEYFKHVFGIPLARKVNPKNVFAGGDEEGTEGAEFYYSAAVNVNI